MVEIAASVPESDDFREQYVAALDTVEKVLEATESHDNITLNLSELSNPSPVFTATVSCVFNQLDSSENVEIEWRSPEDSDVNDYLNKIRFPSGIEYKDNLGKDNVPLYWADPETDGENGKLIQETNEGLREHIETVFSDLSSDATNSIYAALAEIIDNVESHSECNDCVIHAEYDPEEGYVDVCVADNGITIPGCYQKHGFEVESDLHGIDKAVNEHISTRGKRKGNGLALAKHAYVDKMAGCMLVASGDGAMYLNGTDLERVETHEWPGTLVAARINPPQGEFPISKILD